MKTWLRWILIVISVGGGFTGITFTTETLFRQEASLAAWLICGFAILLYLFIVVSGLIFADNPRRTLPLIAALIIQIPWVSSPFFVYGFCTGFRVAAGILDGKIVFNFRFGSYFEFFILGSHPWGAGINFFAVVALILLLRYSQRPKKALEPTGTASATSGNL
jgi:hypothetical protein